MPDRRVIERAVADESGATAVEYAIALALIALVATGAWSALGGATAERARCVSSAIAGAGGPCEVVSAVSVATGALGWAGEAGGGRAASGASSALTSGSHAREPVDVLPYDARVAAIVDRAEDDFEELAGGGDRITGESLRGALESDDADVRETAQWLLANEPARNAMDVGSGHGDVDGEISIEDVRGFEDALRTEELPTLLADTASGGGGDDDEIGREDLEAIAGDESLPEAYREWARQQLAAGAFQHDDCSGFSLCQLGDAADAIGLDSVVDFVWDSSGLDSLVTNTLGGIFWRTWDNITNGAGAWYEWPGDLVIDALTSPFEIGGNVVMEIWALPMWARQSISGAPGDDAPWHLPYDSSVPLHLFVADDKGADAIDPSDIEQGELQSCVTLAGIGAIAAVDPDLIRDAIRDNGDGTYTVTFHDQRPPGFVWEREWRTHTVTVDARVPVDEDGRPIYAGAPNGELWPLILEKAWAEYRGGYHRINGDNGSGLLEALTGHTASFANTAIDLGANLLPGASPALPSFDELAAWHGASRAIITATHGHEMFILDIDEGSRTLTIGDPYGPHRTRVMSYDEWKNSGEFISASVASTD